MTGSQPARGRVGRIFGWVTPLASPASQPRSGERGSTSVETALVMPVLLVILTFLLSVGVYINKNLELSNATSLAGEYLSLSRSTTPASDPCLLVYNSFIQVAPYLTPANLSFTLTIGGTAYTGTTCTSAASALTQGASATLNVTYPCTLVQFGKNLLPSCQLISQVTEIIE